MSAGPRLRLPALLVPLVTLTLLVLPPLHAASAAPTSSAPLSSAPIAAWSGAGVRLLAAEEEATSLHTDFAVDADGSVVVTERISWRFPEGEERHGIYRTVRVRAGYQDSDTQYRYYELSGVEVTSPSGAPTDIAVSDLGEYRKIRIGSPSETVTGVQDYVVRYRLEHIVNDIGDGTAEFYYDLVDTSTGVPQRDVAATVTAPVAATRAACFYGPFGSTTPCEATPGSPARFSVPDLAAEEGASIVTSYPRSAFGDLTPDLRAGDPESAAGGIVSPALSRAFGRDLDHLLPRS